MTIVHICHHCRRAVGTVGPYEDFLFNGPDYYICRNCRVKDDAHWERIKESSTWSVDLPVDGD